MFLTHVTHMRICVMSATPMSVIHRFRFSFFFLCLLLQEQPLLILFSVCSCVLWLVKDSRFRRRDSKYSDDIAQSIGVAFDTHITHMRNLRKKKYL